MASHFWLEKKVESVKAGFTLEFNDREKKMEIRACSQCVVSISMCEPWNRYSVRWYSNHGRLFDWCRVGAGVLEGDNALPPYQGSTNENSSQKASRSWKQFSNKLAGKLLKARWTQSQLPSRCWRQVSRASSQRSFYRTRFVEEIDWECHTPTWLNRPYENGIVVWSSIYKCCQVKSC